MDDNFSPFLRKYIVTFDKNESKLHKIKICKSFLYSISNYFLYI